MQAARIQEPVISRDDRIVENVINFYKVLGNGDVRKGIEQARKTSIRALIDYILNSDSVDQTVKDRTFYVKTSLDFISDYEKML